MAQFHLFQSLPDRTMPSAVLRRGLKKIEPTTKEGAMLKPTRFIMIGSILVTTATPFIAPVVDAQETPAPVEAPVKIETEAPAPAPSPTPAPEVSTDIELPYCEQEDSENCYWDATILGNGQGRSFVNIDGTVYYLGGSK